MRNSAALSDKTTTKGFAKKLCRYLAGSGKHKDSYASTCFPDKLLFEELKFHLPTEEKLFNHVTLTVAHSDRNVS